MVDKEREREIIYAKRSMIGAQCLLEIRARRSLRAFSISLRYSLSTFGAAMMRPQRLQNLPKVMLTSFEPTQEDNEQWNEDFCFLRVYICVCARYLEA